jgi:hypothetical protein
MPDDKSKVGEPDRSKVAADQDYEVSDFAQQYGISIEGNVVGNRTTR